MTQTHIAVVLGTARQGRASEPIAIATTKIINEVPGFSADLVDVRDHVTQAMTTPPWGEGGADTNPTKWQEIVQKSNALILVIPEYNHSFPGELKILLDSLYSDYLDKRVGLIGVSSGIFGGTRGLMHIKPVLLKMGFNILTTEVNVSKAGEAVNEDGDFKDEKTVEYIRLMAANLGRDNDIIST